LWEDEPDYAAFLDEAAKEVGAWGADPLSEIAACRKLKDRLLTDLHMPAVQEALGALIPEWLHPSQDDPKKRGKKKGFGGERVGVNLTVAHGRTRWKLDVFKEEALRGYKPVAKDTMEFFLILARLVSEKLGLSVAIGSNALGQRLRQSCPGPRHSTEPLQRLIDELKDWSSWCRSEVMDARQFLLPVPKSDRADCREWFLLTISSAVEGERLGSADRLRVDVAERSGRTLGFDGLAKRLVELIRGGAAGGKDVALTIEKQEFPVDAAPLDTTLAILGLVWAQVAKAAGVPHLDLDSPAYLAEWRGALTEAFAQLRRQSDRRGNGAVENGFASRDECLHFLDVLARSSADLGVEPEKAVDRGRGEVAESVPAKEESSRHCKLLTWNIAGRDVSYTAKDIWKVPDKLCAMKREILRLKPDVLALQECPGDGVCDAVPYGMELVGSVECHAQGCYTQLYCRSDWGMRPVQLPVDTPAVAGIATVNGVEVLFVSAHLFPYPENAHERAKEVSRILSSRKDRAIVLMGDLNVRYEEIKPLCEDHGLRAMPCSNATWNPCVNKFYPDED